MPILVSVVIPVYKAERYISACIDSVIAQICVDWEMILVDDGSPDNSGAICDEYATRDARIKVIHKKNAGVSAARNDGIQLAQGKYLSFIDSDDYVLPTYLSDMLEYEADVVVTAYRNFFEPTGEWRIDRIEKNLFFSSEKGNLSDALPRMEMDSKWMGPAAKLYLRSIVMDNHLQFDPSLDYGEDHLFNMEFAKYMTSVSYLSCYNYVYMHRDVQSLTNRKVPSMMLFSYITALYGVRMQYCKSNPDQLEYKVYTSQKLTYYFWQTLYLLLQEPSGILEKVLAYHKTLVNIPKMVVFSNKYTLPKTYCILRMLFRMLPDTIAMKLSTMLLIK